MTLNKKQKKQSDLERKKLAQLQQQLSGAKRQMDDPAEVQRLQQEIAACEGRLKKLQEEG
jgi:primosomal protein N''